jgi:hypothetical protein
MQTGEIKEHSIVTTPSWVDRIQPIDFIEEQLNDWGIMYMDIEFFECKQMRLLKD